MNLRSDLYLLSKILAKCEVRTASYEPSFMPGGGGYSLYSNDRDDRRIF